MKRDIAYANMSVETAERIYNGPERDQYCSDPRTTDDLWETLTDSDLLRKHLDQEELAGPLSEMVATLPLCIAELADLREKPAQYQAMLRLVAQVERQLVAYVEGDA